MKKKKLLINKARLIVGFSLDELAGKVKIDRARLSRLENGIVFPTEKEVTLLARALNISKEKLFPIKENHHAL